MNDQTIKGFLITTERQPGDPEGYRRHAFGHDLEDAIANYNDDSKSIGYVGVSIAKQNAKGSPFTIIEHDGVVSAHLGNSVLVEPEEDDDEDEDDEIGRGAEATFG